jgi:hypothetical protein
VPEVVGDDGVDVLQVEGRVFEDDFFGAAAVVEGGDDRVEADARVADAGNAIGVGAMGAGSARRASSAVISTESYHFQNGGLGSVGEAESPAQSRP